MVVRRDDVARAAGVSPAVVSYVLNGGPRPVASATRERVLAAVDQLGYRPDPVARSMRTRRTDSIGLVLPDITHTYFALLTQAISQAAGELGRSVIVATSNGDLGVEQTHIAELQRRRVDGVILMSIDPLQDFSSIDDPSMPILLVDRPRAATETARAAVDHLAADGCVDIVHFAGPAENVTSQRRSKGADEAAAAAGLRIRHVVSANSASAAYDLWIELFRQSRIPDGVVTSTPTLTIGLLRAVADCGLRIPEDVKLIGNELRELGEYGVPRVSSTDSRVSEVASLAVNTLVERLDLGGVSVLAEPSTFTLTARESCGHHPNPRSGRFGTS